MKKILLTGLFLLVAGVAFAQKPVNPREVQFNDPNDYVLMTGWEIAFFLPGATEPVQGPQSIGKPPVTSTGCVLVSPCIIGAINTQPIPFGLNYTAKVRGIAGEFVSEWSDPSGPFDRIPGKPGGTVVK